MELTPLPADELPALTTRQGIHPGSRLPYIRAVAAVPYDPGPARPSATDTGLRPHAFWYVVNPAAHSSTASQYRRRYGPDGTAEQFPLEFTSRPLTILEPDTTPADDHRHRVYARPLPPDTSTE